MEEKYKTWIDNKVKGRPANARNRCMSWTEQMVQEFPELRRVSGFIETTNGISEHWWCETSTGKIVDPTVIQFSGVVIRYEEYLGPEITGKCMNCGNWCFEGFSPASTACSIDCGYELERYYGSEFLSRDENGKIIKNWKDLEESTYAGMMPL